MRAKRPLEPPPHAQPWSEPQNDLQRHAVPAAVGRNYRFVASAECTQSGGSAAAAVDGREGAPPGYPGTASALAGPPAPTLARMWPPPGGAQGWGAQPGWAGNYQPPPTDPYYHQQQQQQWSPAEQPVPPAMPAAGGPKRRAFITGCNYLGTASRLNGCINDARCMEHLLKSKFGFDPTSILLFTDDHPDPMRRPTKANIYMGFQWLMTGLQAGDSLFFHYSGHGGQQPDYSGDEADGMNETLLPLDHQYAGHIVDDELNRMLVNPLPRGVKLHAVVDACHSGSALDLPYMAKVQGGYISWQSEYSRPTSVWKGTAGGFCVQFSAATDAQVAADTSQLSGGVPTGAATFCFIKAIEDRGIQNTTYGDLLLSMWHTLHAAGLGDSGGGAPQGPGGLLGGGGLDSMLMGLLGGALGGSQYRGQNPVLSANYAFDLGFKFSL